MRKSSRCRRGRVAVAILTASVLTPVVGCSALVTSSDDAATTTSGPTTTTTLPPKIRRPILGEISIDALRVDPMEPGSHPGCEFLHGGVWWSELDYFHASAIPFGCDPGPQEPLNGDYGEYRSSADAEPFIFIKQLAPTQTPIGSAEMFVVDYTQCTNDCDSFAVTVAVVTLTEPITVDGVKYDVLNFFSEDPNGEDYDAMKDALASLQR